MPAPYVVEEYVRWSDVDFAGIIFYGSYVRFFEIAETELFRTCGLAYARAFDRYDIFLPRKAVHSGFYVPARLNDRLRKKDVVAVEHAGVGEAAGTEQLRLGDLEEPDVGPLRHNAGEVHVGPPDILFDDVRLGGHRFPNGEARAGS